MTGSSDACTFIIVRVILTNISVCAGRDTYLWLTPLLSCSEISPEQSRLATEPEALKSDAALQLHTLYTNQNYTVFSPKEKVKENHISKQVPTAQRDIHRVR